MNEESFGAIRWNGTALENGGALELSEASQEQVNLRLLRVRKEAANLARHRMQKLLSMRDESLREAERARSTLVTFAQSTERSLTDDEMEEWEIFFFEVTDEEEIIFRIQGEQIFLLLHLCFNTPLLLRFQRRIRRFKTHWLDYIMVKLVGGRMNGQIIMIELRKDV